MSSAGTATVASLDPEQAFYFGIARGIRRATPRRCSTEAFGGEFIDRIEDELLIEALRARLRAWLGSRM